MDLPVTVGRQSFDAVDLCVMSILNDKYLSVFDFFLHSLIWLDLVSATVVRFFAKKVFKAGFCFRLLRINASSCMIPFRYLVELK